MAREDHSAVAARLHVAATLVAIEAVVVTLLVNGVVLLTLRAFGVLGR